MKLKKRVLGLALSAGMVAGMVAVSSPASADLDGVLAGNQIVSCTGSEITASANPALTSGSAKYTKIAIKKADGTKHLSLTGAEDLGPTPLDATVCVVDAGIRTNDPATDSGTKLNPFDDQTSGQNNLAAIKISGALSGSASCNNVDPAVNGDYPAGYPINGKVIFKFAELFAGKPGQIQQYVRLYTDPLDTNPQHVYITGTVIKGPGVGGAVAATLQYSLLFSTKNLNGIDCISNPAAQNASLAELFITGADGVDADAAEDAWTVSIPS